MIRQVVLLLPLGLANAVIFNATNIGANGAINTTDTDETFITGTNPN
jgi:hypothetical protein